MDSLFWNHQAISQNGEFFDGLQANTFNIEFQYNNDSTRQNFSTWMNTTYKKLSIRYTNCEDYTIVIIWTS